MSRLNFTDPIDPIDPVDPVDPVDPTDPNTNRFRNNGIGNGVQAAPGNSEVTNGDIADGADSGGSNLGASFGTARNGDVSLTPATVETVGTTEMARGTATTIDHWPG